MARYDDDDEDFLRRSLGDDFERPRRREDDYPTSRRESLIERRLRRARGEDPDLYDDDDYDYPPVGYGRGRGGYAPRYATPSGGCVNAVLYLSLGGIVVFAVVLLLGNQLFNRLPSSVPAQIRQVIATPTPTVRDRGGTIVQIRQLSRLETQSFAVERVVEASMQRGNVLDLLLGDRLLLIASGTVVAGVDLGKLQDGDVQLSEDGTRITLRLPPSEIFTKALDNERTRVYDREAGIFAPENKDLETQARQAAEDEILRAACEGGIMQKAADEAQQSLQRFLGLLEFESVEVVATAGPCVASPTAPTVPAASPAAAPATAP